VLSDNYRRPKGRHHVVNLFFCHRLLAQGIWTFVFVAGRDKLPNARLLLLRERHVEIPSFTLPLVCFSKFEKFKHAVFLLKTSLQAT
jgi:hypothetical protein